MCQDSNYQQIVFVSRRVVKLW